MSKSKRNEMIRCGFHNDFSISIGNPTTSAKTSKISGKSIIVGIDQTSIVFKAAQKYLIVVKIIRNVISEFFHLVRYIPLDMENNMGIFILRCIPVKLKSSYPSPLL